MKPMMFSRRHCGMNSRHWCLTFDMSRISQQLTRTYVLDGRPEAPVIPKLTNFSFAVTSVLTSASRTPESRNCPFLPIDLAATLTRSSPDL